jgi:hypothetical protein
MFSAAIAEHMALSGRFIARRASYARRMFSSGSTEVLDTSRIRSLPVIERWMAKLPEAVKTRMGATYHKKLILPMPFAIATGAFTLNLTLQHYLGTSKDFFYGSFETDKDADAIADFYQAEDLLKIISIHPFFFSLFMDKVVVGETPEKEEDAKLVVGENVMIVKKLGMEAVFQIYEEEEEDEESGEQVRKSFKRYERFLDYVPFLADFEYKFLLWDQTWTFGFRRKENGKYEVYHKGEYFQGPWPIRVIVFFHQRYVLWACKKFICNEAFANEEDGADERREKRLECMLMAPKSRKVYASGRGMRIVVD